MATLYFDKYGLTPDELQQILTDTGYLDTKIVDMSLVEDPEGRYLASYSVLFDDLDGDTQCNVYLWCERNGKIRADF